MVTNQQKDREIFEDAIRALEAQIANIGVHMVIDSDARQIYTKQIQAMSVELGTQASMGKISWSNAAEQAQSVRNTIMEIVRTKSTPVGVAMAEQLKSEGKTLNELVARKSQQLYGKNIVFSHLTQIEKNSIYAEIVKSAGKSNPEVTATMNKLSYAGKSLIFVSIALSVYTIATAENKSDAAGREVVITGTGIGGSIAGGAIAGLICGPGAPVCVTIGAFIGGAFAAFGVSVVW